MPTGTIFGSSVRAPNVRDFLQTKLDSEINSPFLLSLHGNPEQSIKVFEEEKKFDSRT